MSQEYEVRKIHHEGEHRISKGMTIPHKFLKELSLQQGDYVKIYLGEDLKGSKRMWIEKVQD